MIWVVELFSLWMVNEAMLIQGLVCLSVYIRSSKQVVVWM